MAKHAGGRPTEYKEEYIQKVDEYLESCVDEEWDWTKTDGDKSTSYEHRIKVKLPTIDGFAQFIDVPRRCLYDWKEKNEEFSHSLDKIVTEQKRRLLDRGLSGDYNPKIAALILSANHNMREKSDITTNDERLPTPIYGGLSVQGHDSNEESLPANEEN